MFTIKVITNTLISSLLLVSSSSIVSGQRPRLAKGMCSAPVGRVINGSDFRFVAGSQICPQDMIQPVKGSMVKVICYNRRTVEVTQDNRASQVCSESAAQPRKICILNSQGNCNDTRAPEEKRNPTLITPYVGRIINPRPTLNWLDVPGATSYIVQVQGFGINWSRVVQSTSLEYPSSESAMEWGRIYKVNVIANEGDEPVSASSSVTIVLSQQEAQEIKSVVEQIQNLNLSSDEQVIDLDAVYMSKNLITEAIGVLKARVDSGTTNPTIHRMLGDRYLDTGLLEPNSRAAARKAYAQATKLAQQKNDADELAKVQAGMKLLDQSQAPTKTNAAQ